MTRKLCFSISRGLLQFSGKGTKAQNPSPRFLTPDHLSSSLFFNEPNLFQPPPPLLQERRGALLAKISILEINSSHTNCVDRVKKYPLPTGLGNNTTPDILGPELTSSQRSAWRRGGNSSSRICRMSPRGALFSSLLRLQLNFHPVSRLRIQG